MKKKKGKATEATDIGGMPAAGGSRPKRVPVSPEALGDRQSVRKTFRISREAAEAMHWLAKENKITIKDVIDYTCRMLPSLVRDDPGFRNVLVESQRTGDPGRTVRKTQVVTRGAVRILTRLQEIEKVPRDVLLQSSITYLKARMEAYKNETRQRYRKALELVRDLCSRAESIEKEIRALLESDEEIVTSLGRVVDNLQILCADIEEDL